jgi:hypothetical protein
LTAQQQKQLELHLSVCADCREIKAQYETVIATTLPVMAANHKQERDHESSDSWSIEQAEASLMARIECEDISPEDIPSSPVRTLKWRRLPWSYVGVAAFAVISLLAAYRIGTVGRRALSETVSQPLARAGEPHPSDNHLDAVAHPIHRMPDRRDEVSDLHRQLQMNMTEVNRLNQQLSGLKDQLANRKSLLDHDSQERIELQRRLSISQTDAEQLKEELSIAATQNSQANTESLRAQVSDLSSALREKNKSIAQQEELLEHDRDIRNLIGARDLYIAEIYDVAKTGKTQKPYGRVFYTKGKSLVFYAYDLDQQPGVKLASTFQAWGRKGVDQQHDINLGIFYQDDQSKKRWILKSNDPVTLAQIDAVFVTVEPNGESAKPSGKPLLFTYLRLTPNHP